MILVRHRVDKSTIHGLGVFTEEAIRSDQIIWKMQPQVDLTYSEAQWESLKKNLAPACFEQIEKYCYKDRGTYHFCIDNSQFMNHSKSKANIRSDMPGNTMIATRDISPGEELICNYYEFCDADDFNIRCIEEMKKNGTIK